MSKRIGVIIPVWNVEKTIEKVLSSFSVELLAKIDDILVVDNQSTDSTLLIVREFQKHHPIIGHKITIIQHRCNYGYGGSVKTGFEYFIRAGHEFVMILHGDFQENPAVIASNFFKILDNSLPLDLIIASRFTPESDIRNYSLARKLGNYFFNWVTFLMTGLKMSDSGTAIILVRTSVLARFPFANLSNSWQFHPQLNIFLYGDRSIRLKEIPLHWSDSEVKSSLNLIQYGWVLLKMLLKYRFERTILGKTPEEIFQPDHHIKRRDFDLFPNNLGTESNLASPENSTF